MDFDIGLDMPIQSYSESNLYPAALEDGDLLLATNMPSNYWIDDSWQGSTWPTADAFGFAGLAGLPNDGFLACPAVYPMQAAPDHTDTSFVSPEQLQLTASDCYSVAQSESEVQVENAQPHDCPKVQALEDRVDSLEKLLSSRETEPLAAFQAYTVQMQEWLVAFMERAETLAEEVRSAAGTSNAV